MLLGSIVTSSHDTREACEGRAVLLKEKGVVGKCVDQGTIKFSTSSLTTIWPNTIICGNGKPVETGCQ